MRGGSPRHNIDQAKQPMLLYYYSFALIGSNYAPCEPDKALYHVCANQSMSLSPICHPAIFFHPSLFTVLV